MKGDFRKLGASLAASGLTFAGLYLIGTAPLGHPVPLFPYWIFLGLVVVGGCVYLWSVLQAGPTEKASGVASLASDESVHAEGPTAYHLGSIGASVLVKDRDTMSDVNMPRLVRTAEPVVTDHWRFTPVSFDVTTLDNIGNKGFTHPKYMRQWEDKPPAVRIGAFVACGPLGEEEPVAEELRGLFRGLLAGDPFVALIALLTDIGAEAEWHSQPGRRRFNLEADLRGEDMSQVPVASAMLLLPDPAIGRYGTDRRGAELVLHVDLPLRGGVPVKAGLPKWHERFTYGLALPRELARWLDDLGLRPSGEPAARFAVQVQARTSVPSGMEEIVDTSTLTPLFPPRYSPQFDGSAMAGQDGRTAGGISKQFVREMCEDIGRTGYETILAGLPE